MLNIRHMNGCAVHCGSLDAIDYNYFREHKAIFIRKNCCVGVILVSDAFDAFISCGQKVHIV